MDADLVEKNEQVVAAVTGARLTRSAFLRGLLPGMGHTAKESMRWMNGIEEARTAVVVRATPA